MCNRKAFDGLVSVLETDNSPFNKGLSGFSAARSKSRGGQKTPNSPISFRTSWCSSTERRLQPPNPTERKQTRTMCQRFQRGQCDRVLSKEHRRRSICPTRRKGAAAGRDMRAVPKKNGGSAWESNPPIARLTYDPTVLKTEATTRCASTSTLMF